MFSNLSLKAKLIFGFGLVCAGLCGMSAESYFGLQKIIGVNDKISTYSLPNLGHTSGLRARGRQVHVETVKLAIYPKGHPESEKILASLNKALTRYEEISNEYKEKPFIPGEEIVYDDAFAKWKDVKKASLEILSLYNSENPQRAALIYEKLIPFEEFVRVHQDAVKKLDDFNVDQGGVWTKEARTVADTVKTVTIWAALILTVVSLLGSLLFTQKISLTLRTIAARLRESSSHVSENANEALTSSEELSESVTEQAASVQETVSATNEISSMVQKNAESADFAIKKAEESKRSSSRGQNAVNEMIQSIEEISEMNSMINQQINTSNKELTEIVSMISEIASKTTVINDIVFQTKLLSFNASVEAARAGEQGKGFSVVAQEVGTLARSSGKAAQEISTLLDKSTERIHVIVKNTQEKITVLMNNGNVKIEQGREKTRICSQALEEMIGGLQEMGNMIQEISTASKEQATGVAEINNALELISITTTKNSTAAQKSSEISTNLMNEVKETNTAVDTLVSIIDGQSAATFANNVETIKVKSTKKKPFKKAA